MPTKKNPKVKALESALSAFHPKTPKGKNPAAYADVKKPFGGKKK